MTRGLIFASMALLLALASHCAAEPKILTLSLPNPQKVNPSNGEALYKSYCTSCHGLDGTGNGPIAHSLQTHPSDLTHLAVHYQGKYPSHHVLETLKAGPWREHANMPNWSTFFNNSSSNFGNPLVTHIRLYNLNSYIKTLQKAN